MSLSVWQTQRGSAKAPIRRRRSRGTGQRTRAGCFTCKARRVKCDETKPACRRCTDFGRTCEGYPDAATLPLPPRNSVRPVPSNPCPPILESQPFISDEGSRQGSTESDQSFDGFLQYTMPNLPGYFAPGFWPRLIGRVAQNEPAIQSALSALAAIHSATVERQSTGPSTVTTPGSTDSAHKVALQHYDLAIGQLKLIMKNQRAQGTESILVCCLLFICIEALFGDFDSAKTHAEAGLEVYRDWFARTSPIQQENIPSAANGRYCTWRLGAEMESMLGELANRASFTIDVTPIVCEKAWIFGPHVKEFRTLEHVSCALVYLRRLLRRLIRATEVINVENQAVVPDSVMQQYKDLDALYRAFEIPYHKFMASIPPEGVTRCILVMQVRYLTQDIIHSSMFGKKSERALIETYEDLLHTVGMILKLIPAIEPATPPVILSDSGSLPIVLNGTIPSVYDTSYSQESGVQAPIIGRKTRIPNFCIPAEIVPCLFHTAKAAPTVSLRQKAISLLYVSNTTEGIWNSYTAAKMAEEQLAAHLAGSDSFSFIDYPRIQQYGPQSGELQDRFDALAVSHEM